MSYALSKLVGLIRKKTISWLSAHREDFLYIRLVKVLDTWRPLIKLCYSDCVINRLERKQCVRHLL